MARRPRTSRCRRPSRLSGVAVRFRPAPSSRRPRTARRRWSRRCARRSAARRDRRPVRRARHLRAALRGPGLLPPRPRATRCWRSSGAGAGRSRSSIATFTAARSTPRSLAAFDAVVLDPPRAGAPSRSRQLAASAVPRIAYVSCNPATFARDAEMLVDGRLRARLGRGRSASSAGRPMSSWRPPSAARVSARKHRKRHGNSSPIGRCHVVRRQSGGCERAAACGGFPPHELRLGYSGTANLGGDLQQSLIGLDTDVSWLITVGEKMLDGQRLYIDIFEVNPPASVWIYFPGIAVARAIGVTPNSRRPRWSSFSRRFRSAVRESFFATPAFSAASKRRWPWQRPCSRSSSFPAPALPSASIWPC